MSSQTRQAQDGAMQLAIQRHQASDMDAAETLQGKGLSRQATRQRPNEATFQFNLGLAHQASGDTRGAALPDASIARLASLLRNPAPGIVGAERLQQLRELAGRNFGHLPAR